MNYSFYALVSRMKNITRWSLMRNSFAENVQEHSHMVAVIAHSLAVIRQEVFGIPCNADRAASVALFHDASEIYTGDMPTPIKYFNPEIMTAYKQVEELASEKLVSTLPEKLQGAYRNLLLNDDEDIETAIPDTTTEDEGDLPKASMLFSRKAVQTNLENKLRHHMIAEAAKIAPKEAKPTGRKVDDLYDRLNLLKH